MMKILLFLVLVPLAAGSCNFPADLAGDWTYQDRNDSVVTEYYNVYYVNVNGDTFNATPAFTRPSSLKLYPFTWTCSVQDNLGKYVVKVNNTGYMCVEFVKRAESVMQMKTTDVVTSAGDVNCQEDAFHLDPWPLLRDQWRSSKCPAIGGFWADYYDQNNKRRFGMSSTGVERIEFECTKNEGIFVYTRRDFDQYKQQLFKKWGKHLGCRGFWTEGKFTFIATGGLLNRGLNLKHNAIMRYNTADAESDRFDVYIFKDVVAPTTDVPDPSYNFLKASLYREKMDSMCVDHRYKGTLRNLDSCDSMSEEYANTCGLCNSTRYNFCTFNASSGNSRFSWKPYYSLDGFFADWRLSDNPDEQLIINNNWINLTTYESLRCMERQRGDQVTLVQLSSNGCSPRYYCLKLHRKSPSVVTYILSKPAPSVHAVTFRPQPNIRLDNNVCRAGKYYDYNQDASSLQYFTTDDNIYRVMVNPTDTKLVNCDLDYHLYINMNVSSEVQCDVTLSPENDKNLNMRYSNCTDGRDRPDLRYDCLFSRVPETALRFNDALWVVQLQSDPKTYRCIAANIGKLFIAPLDKCMVQSNDNFYEIKYADQAIYPQRWLRRWKGSPITSFMKIDNSVDTTISSPTENQTQAATSMEDTKSTHTSTASFVQPGLISVITYILSFQYSYFILHNF